MSITYYKPNSSNKGSLLSVNFSAKTDKVTDGKLEKGDKSFYFKLIAQTSWDQTERTGGFKDGKSIVVKMSPTEISGVIYAITRKTTLAAAMNQEYVYHDGEKAATTIYFGPHFKKIKDGDKWVDSDKQDGFGLRVIKTEKANKDNKEQLSITLTPAESELLVNYCRDGLSHIFNAFYSEDVNRAKTPKKDDVKPGETIKAEPELEAEQPPPDF